VSRGSFSLQSIGYRGFVLEMKRAKHTQTVHSHHVLKFTILVDLAILLVFLCVYSVVITESQENFGSTNNVSERLSPSLVHRILWKKCAPKFHVQELVLLEIPCGSKLLRRSKLCPSTYTGLFQLHGNENTCILVSDVCSSTFAHETLYNV
jgi:hypothetical protein